MGVASSKVFVNRMLRNGLDESTDECAGNHYNGTFDDFNCIDEALHRQEQLDDDEDDAQTNLLLSLVVHPSNVHKNKQLLQRKLAALRRRRARVTTLREKKRRMQYDVKRSSLTQHQVRAVP